MARRSLTTLIQQDAAPAPPQTPVVANSVSADSGTTGLPKYLQLVRKEARLTEAQYAELTSLARQLNRRRSSRNGERITENTLIRIAVDLLLTRGDRLHGDTEQDLAASVR